MLSHFNRIWLFASQWTVDCQRPRIHGILQARILEWVAMSSSRGFSWPWIESGILTSPVLAGAFFTIIATWETLLMHGIPKFSKKISSLWDFPGGPVVKTPGLQCRGPWVWSWSENWIPHDATTICCNEDEYQTWNSQRSKQMKMNIEKKRQKTASSFL